ncbi:MAG: FkbM family methyltransferase [Synergistaceae bacterium]|jgi:FkbM family methyltransferase|nr:FkbM family methyltransferase [Synergistaceae bacterium]
MLKLTPPQKTKIKMDKCKKKHDGEICKILAAMIDDECKRVNEQVKPFTGRKFAIFSAGAYARRFYSWLSCAYGKDAECYIDNNPSFAGQTACGKFILLRPWEKAPNFKDDSFVLIATIRDDYARQIARQLSDCGVPHVRSSAFQVAHGWERYSKVVNTLDDDFSKLSYLGELWRWLTGDNEYVQAVDHQYFAPKEFMTCYNEIVCDCGAYVGDTMEEYVKRGVGIGSSTKIYAFEPNPPLCTKMRHRLARLQMEWELPDDQIEIIMGGVGATSGIERFDMMQGEAVRTEDGGNAFEVHAIDDFFADRPKPTLIKADIEGMETDMLYGAKQTIRENKPKLAICLYHSPDDFYRVPEIVLELNPNYKLLVRSHSMAFNETILYCVDDT